MYVHTIYRRTLHRRRCCLSACLVSFFAPLACQATGCEQSLVIEFGLPEDESPWPFLFVHAPGRRARIVYIVERGTWNEWILPLRQCRCLEPASHCFSITPRSTQCSLLGGTMTYTNTRYHIIAPAPIYQFNSSDKKTWPGHQKRM